VTPLYPQKLALTSPTGGGRSVGIVRSRTKATEFFFFYFLPVAQRSSAGHGLLIPELSRSHITVGRTDLDE